MLIIAVRDYLATVRTKSFLIGLLLIPSISVIGGLVVFGLGMLLVIYGDIEEKRFAVVDRTPGEKIFPHLQEAASLHNKQFKPQYILERVAPSADQAEEIAQQRYDLSERVLRGEFFGFLDIGPDVCCPPLKKNENEKPIPNDAALAPKLSQAALGIATDSERVSVRYQTDRSTNQLFPLWAERIIDQAVLKQRWIEAKMPREKMPSLRSVSFRTTGLSRRDQATGAIKEPRLVEHVAGFLLPVGLALLMYLAVMLSSGPAMQNVVEEKMQRIAEVLLGSVGPFDLMMGKLLGLTAVSLTISFVYLSLTYGAAYAIGLAEFLPMGVLFWFLLYQILALMMFGSLSLAIGAAATDIKGTQPFLLPLGFLAMFPLFFFVPILQDPNSAFATGLSFFPLATPILMVTRMTVPPGIPWWQPVLGVVPVLATTFVCVYVAGRIFRVGILMQGGGARYGDLIRWVIRG